MDVSAKRRWSAQWVWPAGNSGSSNSYTYFRAEFDCETPTGHTFYVSADSRYRLWINGTLLGDGPPPSVPNLVYYDKYDITPHLQIGRNCVAAVVRYTGVEPGRRAGFLAECETADRIILATGSNAWRCHAALAWVPFTFRCDLNLFDPYQEGFVAGREPEGWRQPGFNENRSEQADPGATGVPAAVINLGEKLNDEAMWNIWKETGEFDNFYNATWEIPEVVAEVSDQPQRQSLWAELLNTPIPPMAESPIYPQAVTKVEECLSLANRNRHDLTILLSQAGRPLHAATVKHPERFVTGAGSVVMARSDKHLTDRTVDGVYDPCVLLDLGRVETAYVDLDVEGQAGATLDIGFAERLVDGHFNNAIDSQFALRYVLKEGRQCWRSFAWRGFRYMRVRLTDASAPVTVHHLRAIVTRYPFRQVGAFTSSDTRLNGIFEMCRHTIQLCCHTGIMDTPWREQNQHLGDVAAVTVRGIYACFGDTALPNKFFRQAAATQSESGTLAGISNAALDNVRWENSLIDYNLWWVVALRDYYSYSGDISLVGDLFNTARNVLEAVLAHRTDRGLVRSFGGVLIDWADLDRSGECAALNAIFHGALQAGVELAGAINAHSEEIRWTACASQLHAAFFSRFWDDSRGILVDAVSDGIASERVSEHANFAAIRFGLLPDDVATDVAIRLLVKHDVEATEAQPFFTAVILDALHDLGLTDLALDVIRDRWGKRMLDRGSTSCHEEWGMNGTWRSGSYAGRMRSLSHAWSAHPATFLIEHLAGIKILEPGCRTLRVEPAIVGLDYNSTFPTPLGPVNVRVQSGCASVRAPKEISIICDNPDMTQQR